MRIRIALATVLTVVLAAVTTAHAGASKVAVVAAENFYGDVAQQIGGDRVSVISILSNPNQDPHLFEASPSVVREIAAAQVIVYNGAGYDPWMTRLLDVTPRAGRAAIVAAGLMNKKNGDNPHLWYDPATMPTVAGAIAAALSATDPGSKDAYSAQLKAFLASLQPLNKKIAEIGAKYAGTTVTATEPVFGYMAAALHLTLLNQSFQLAVMNNTEPSARDIAGFERDLTTHKARVMFYNSQASDDIVQHLVALARASNIPVVGVTETCPPGLTYQKWMQAQLDEAEAALARPSS
jgi:zinc/manganese transport system substrate-binding protein